MFFVAQPLIFRVVIVLDSHLLREMFVDMQSQDWHPSPENACHNSYLMRLPLSLQYFFTSHL